MPCAETVLVEYGSDDDEDGDDGAADEHRTPERPPEPNSDDELQRSISAKVAAWPRKAERYIAIGEPIYTHFRVTQSFLFSAEGKPLPRSPSRSKSRSPKDRNNGNDKKKKSKKRDRSR